MHGPISPTLGALVPPLFALAACTVLGIVRLFALSGAVHAALLAAAHLPPAWQA